ncbi:NfeD family protein [Staphylococcus canis]|uniref:NfeD family protein n=1 Tax=Staphylococcus canis TaxID=2724942 RepID=UPI003D81A26A
MSVFLSSLSELTPLIFISKWITSQVISLLLTCVIFLSFLIQIYSKRFNFSGVISVLALLLLFLGFILQGGVSLITLSTFLIGIILIIIELFVVGAILGIIGMILVVISLITMGDNLSLMFTNIVVALILSVIEWVILAKFFKKKITLFENVVLKDSTNKESGYTSHTDRSYLIGAIGTTHTDLRPSGIILIDDQRIDAVSEGSFIPKQTKVKIIEVEGTRVVVREI